MDVVDTVKLFFLWALFHTRNCSTSGSIMQNVSMYIYAFLVCKVKLKHFCALIRQQIIVRYYRHKVIANCN